MGDHLQPPPGCAAGQVGWPFGQRCLAYFDRLAVTPVSHATAVGAAQRIAREDADAMRGARGPSAAGGASAPNPLASHPQGVERMEEPLSFRRADDLAAGLAPRM